MGTTTTSNRILFYSEAWGKGGIETFINNLLPFLIGAGYQADVFTTWDWKNQDDTALDKLNVARYTTFHGYRPGQVRRLIAGPRDFRTLLETGDYGIVWINTMNGMGLRFARVAKHVDVPIVIAHSHNADVGDGAKTLKRIASRAGTMLWGGCPTVNLACSSNAGKHLFGSLPYELIRNGVNVMHFRFSEGKREAARKELGIGKNTTLLGNIGRINSQKNPLFQLDVFAEYKKTDQTAMYLMLGRHDMAKEVKSRADALGLTDSLILRNPVADTSSYYCALDAFLMPSFYEGLGFAQIEAQCAALPLLSSNNMPSEADVTELSWHCSLKDSPKTWADRLHVMVKQYGTRRTEDFYMLVKDAGFSVDDTARKVLSILDSERKKHFAELRYRGRAN